MFTTDAKFLQRRGNGVPQGNLGQSENLPELHRGASFSPFSRKIHAVDNGTVNYLRTTQTSDQHNIIPSEFQQCTFVLNKYKSACDGTY